jgi:hypothetical protein
MNTMPALNDFLTIAVDASFYEPVSQAYLNTLNAIDFEWAQKTQAICKKIGVALGATVNTVRGNYGNYASLIGYVTTDPYEPLSGLSETNYAAVDPTVYATVDARRAAEVAALNAAPAPWGALLANVVDEIVKRDTSITLANYPSMVCIPAVIEVASAEVADEEFAEVVLASWNQAIDEAPLKALGKRPLYTVVQNDTLESISRAVYGTPERVDDLVSTLKLSAPFIWPTYRDGCVYPGFRVSIPNDGTSSTDEEIYGQTWALEVKPASSGVVPQQWDIIIDDGGVVEVAGMMALMTELSLRAVQPIGEWKDDDVSTYGRHMPIGEKMSQRGGLREDFSLAAALLADPRVLTASPITATSGFANGLLIENVLVVPIGEGSAVLNAPKVRTGIRGNTRWNQSNWDNGREFV